MERIQRDAILKEAHSRADSIGEKFTDARQLVLRALLENSDPQKAYDILANVSKLGDRNTKPPTVYRALEFLCKIGIVHKIESDSTYSVCLHDNHCDKKNHSPLFLICKNCNKVEEIHIHELESQIIGAAKSKGFSISRIIIEAVGVCTTCSSENNISSH